jgi:energy-coupling factor transporter transmembrane protein EcfT
MSRLIPYLWLATTLAWLVVVVVTDQPAWQLAIWIVTAIVPITALERQSTGG